VLSVAPSDLNIGLFVERIDGYGQDVHISTEIFEPRLLQFAAVAYDADAFEFQVLRLSDIPKSQYLFAISNQFAKKFRFEKRFSTSKVYLLHSGFLEESKTDHGLFDGFDV
jgi:hypothetical protein